MKASWLISFQDCHYKRVLTWADSDGAVATLVQPEATGELFKRLSWHFAPQTTSSGFSPTYTLGSSISVLDGFGNNCANIHSSLTMNGHLLRRYRAMFPREMIQQLLETCDKQNHNEEWNLVCVEPPALVHLTRANQRDR